MATILPFSSFDDHLKIKESSRGALLDTNILISYSHETTLFYEDTLDIFSSLKKANFKIYSNVTTRSEFIDYQRRLAITEELVWLGEEADGILSYAEIARKLKAHKSNVKKRAESDNPLILNDSDIKQFKKLLSIAHRNTNNLWLKFCSDNLTSRLERTFDVVNNLMKLRYLSLRKEDRSSEVVKEVEWGDMYKISERSGLSVNDSMILNLFECTNIPYLFTTDFDLVYAASISEVQKVVFCPDSIYKDYKDNYFHLL